MAKKKTSKKKPARVATARTSTALGSVSVEELQAELARRNRKVSSLERKREKLREQLAAVEAELSAHGALSATGGIRKRPKNELSLVETLQQVLKGQTLSVTEAAQAARDAGYMTTAANFRTIVNQTLIRESKLFKKVARGQYTAK